MATRKSFDKERWEAMTGMEMSQLLPECENPESAGEVTDHAGNEILPTVTEQSGIQEPVRLRKQKLTRKQLTKRTEHILYN